MESIIIFIVAIVIISFFLYSAFFSRKAIIKRKVRKAEYKKISAFKDGETAKIVGNVEFVDPPLEAPLSMRECTYYYVHIEKKVSTGKSSKWVTVIEEEQWSRFVIKDEGRFAVLGDEKLKTYIVQDENYSSGFWNDASPKLEQYLNEHGEESEGLLGINKTLRYKEGVLEEDEEIAVFGTGIWKDAGKLYLPEKYERVLEISSHDQDAVYLSDDPDTTVRKVIKHSKPSKRQDFKKSYKRNNNYRK